MDITIHQVKKIKISEIKTVDDTNWITIVVYSANNIREEITFFAKDADNLKLEKSEHIWSE